MTAIELLQLLQQPELPTLARLYGARPAALDAQRERYTHLLKRFAHSFPGAQRVALFSAPGRTEVGGNHTDHNHGRVLAAAVNLDVLAAASPTADGRIVIQSEGYRPLVVDTRELGVVEAEKNTSTALVRGICANLRQLGYQVGGFQAAITSSVPNGSGLSSSAAFEMMIVAILNGLYNAGKITPVEAALIGKYAENVYFGKPSGLMDQMTSAVGGFVTIDFADADQPVIHKLHYDFATSGYTLGIIGAGGSHADLTDEYAAAAGEMRAVANFFGARVLREINQHMLIEALPQLRGKLSDRAILRAFHFFADNERVVQQVLALEAGAFDRFLALVIDSGRSSWMYLQNVYTILDVREQGLGVALALAETILQGRGAWRVHGGGFAGTIQAFVPDDLAQPFFAEMGRVFGAENCHAVAIRSAGAVQVDLGGTPVF